MNRMWMLMLFWLKIDDNVELGGCGERGMVINCWMMGKLEIVGGVLRGKGESVGSVMECEVWGREDEGG